ncbi:DNA-directed RNA polymerase subunit alpha C-terminal domain-containing protein [Alienimonas chondri]|uniref:DNA-directed RNA polymerase subunit alpha n=1 Tax=Alienimonas chondri TaxID=2681879 RepID=A0ABX1V7F8_9PLAN|nr:DNA-directed RNA polymerase subunit alpha C-terminal domain-containing protein [Alienimonas chondri]NNJ24135.1 DNA-directed RNA polymerase subunit alpha [Alienimonas chondri]
MSAGSPLADLQPAQTPDGVTTGEYTAAGMTAPPAGMGGGRSSAPAFLPGGGTSAEQADQVDVVGTLRGDGPFGADQVALLEKAVAGTQPAEVRQHLQELENEIGDDGNDRQNTAAGVTHYLLGEHEQAAERLNEVDGDPLVDYYLAQALLSLKDWDGAIDALQTAASNGYDEVQCELEKAGVVRQAGDTEKADELLTAVSRKAATRAEYSYQKGCVMADRGDTLGAIEYFERAVDMDPRHSKAMFRLAGLMDLLGEDREAIRLYEQSLSKPPLFMGALMNLGLLYEDAENYPAAAYCFRRVLQVYPNHERALLFLKDVAAATSMYYDEEAMRRQRELEQQMRIPITDFELTARSRNGLERAGIATLGDLCRTSEAELLAAKNFGDTSLNEIREILEGRGLRIGQLVEQDSMESGGYGYGGGYQSGGGMPAPTQPGQPSPLAAVSPVGGPGGAPAGGGHGGAPKLSPFVSDDISPAERAKLERPVSDLNLSVRARKCLTRLGIVTMGELVSRTPDDLMSVRNFGVTSLNEIRQKLVDFDLKLRND